MIPSRVNQTILSPRKPKPLHDIARTNSADYCIGQAGIIVPEDNKVVVHLLKVNIYPTQVAFTHEVMSGNKY